VSIGRVALELLEHTMSEYETDMIKLVKQIAEDLQWLRRRAEERDGIKKQEDEELLKRIEKTHRGPTKTRGGSTSE
jgi:hypothetical protein